MLGLVVVVALLPARQCWAADITLSVQVLAQDGQVDVTVSNSGSDTAPDVKVEVAVAGKRYPSQSVGDLPAGEEVKRDIKITAPQKPGSYPILTWVHYTNDDQRMSHVHATYLDHEQAKRLASRPALRRAQLREYGYLTAFYDKRHRFTLLLPEEITIVDQKEIDGGTRCRLKNSRLALSSKYTIYGVLENLDDGGAHSSRIVNSRLSTKKVVKAKSLFSAEVLAAFALVFLVVAYVLFRRATKDPNVVPAPRDVALVRWSFSIFTVATLFFIFQTAYVVPDWFLVNFNALDFRPLNEIYPKVGEWTWRILRTVISRFYLEGGDYDLFAIWVLDPLFIYVVVANYFTLRYVSKPEAGTDKYWHLAKSVLTLPTMFSRKRELHWSKYCKVAVLTLLVKIFYVPLLCSWAINNIFHQRSLIANFSLDWMKIHGFFIAGLILIDVAIFAFGYLVELPQLDNQIKSVEPTLFGWVVCLACYPPFNSFSFSAYEHTLMGADHTPTFGFWRYWALAMVAMLWFFYAWATVALGVRSSNLTNRGIVDSGPYAYVRHPAYIAKTMLWAVSAMFMGDRNFWMCIGLFLTYGARAWTEERHLSRDPDYLKYRQKVPYRFIPWVW